ncbi:MULTISPECIES: hypothetical protein [Mycetohabitans]|uniref:hypothetical protein n=1 Tax=Mycetohabitans TaxID=2571159 RepID=UPI00147C5168|nr:hypothetical protein [Mycetohabitans sp. B3]MCG1040371.1 hypothetical protein [Mycetohabitans sp. B7]
MSVVRVSGAGALGDDYLLSKRTDLYAAYRYDKFTDQSTVGTFGVSLCRRF